jgi:hypothetical protein
MIRPRAAYDGGPSRKHGATVDVRIGVTFSPREIELELADDTDADALRARVESALSAGQGVLWLTDRKGRQVGVAVDKLAWIELGTGSDKGRIGFGG